MAKTLGILGGLGPAAGFRFCGLITDHTLAKRDQDHLDIVLISSASIPDRSEYILGQSKNSPLPAMTEAVNKLIACGADIIAIPCNTAHYFYDEIEKNASIPVLNIVKETASLAKKAGIHKIGIMATTGTVNAGAYQRACEETGIAYLLPCEASQKKLMDMIYGSIKTAGALNTEDFLSLAEELRQKGAEAIILGCTELSLIPATEAFEKYCFIDSLLVLAAKSIRECGKTPYGFSEIYSLI